MPPTEGGARPKGGGKPGGGKPGAGGGGAKGKKPGKPHHKGPRRGDDDGLEPRAKVSTTRREESDIKQLDVRIAAEMPPPGSTETSASDFAQLPLSRYTLTGLQRAKFRSMTQIQRITIPHALAG